VVIGDRLFTLPIQVEGHDDPAQDENMEVDNNNDGHEDEPEKDDQLSENQEGPAKGKQAASSSKQPPPTKQGGEQMNEAPVVEDASDDEYNGQQVSKYPSSYCPLQIHIGITQGAEENTLAVDSVLQGLLVSPKTQLRSKRREMTVDEHSLERAEWIKAKKNLDVPGTSLSNSFLSFTDSHIASNINTLGIHMGSNLQQGIDNLRTIWRRIEGQYHIKKIDTDARSNSEFFVDMTDDDSDLGFDQQVLNNIIGDLAEEALGENSGHYSDFKAVPKRSKSSSHKKNRKGASVTRNKNKLK
jgi:hypothetical protein